MEKVIAGLRASEIPRIEGHEMQTLIHAFEQKARKVFNAEDSARLKTALENAATTAKTLDAWLLFNRPNTESEREQLLAILERIAGECRGIAGVLKRPA